MPLRYAVIVAMAAAGVAFLINLSKGNLIDLLFAGAYLAAVYFGVYNKLTTDISTAKNTALVLAGLAGFLLLYALASQRSESSFIVGDLVACVCLVYAFLQLRDLEKKANGT